MSPDRARLDAHLAYLVHHIRTDWDQPGIAAQLAKLHDRPLAAVALAAITAAATRPDQRTPAVIASAGSHWRDFPRHEPTPTPDQYTQEPVNTAPPDRASAYLAEIRANLHGGTTTP